MMRSLFSGLFSWLLLAGVALGSPVLRSEVLVTSAVVTVGDMFEQAGVHAEQPLFRAPAPGTSGIVTVDAVRQAAALVGLTEFSSGDVLRVRVGRDAATVDEHLLTSLLLADLKARGIVNEGVSAATTFDQSPLLFQAEAVQSPAKLISLRYMPGTGTFVSRFLLAGIDAPVDLSGHIELMVEAPHLVNGMRAGAVIAPADVEMRAVPLKFAESAGYAEPEQVIGKALVRQTRAGTALRAADVTEPELISRNDQVTILYRRGPLTLTVRGQALEGATAGGSLKVLNLMSKKVIDTVVTGAGTVEIPGAASTDVAGL